jgi:hypothetical protein
MHDRVRDQLASDQEHVVTRRSKFLDLAERRPDNRGSPAPTFNLQRQQLAPRFRKDRASQDEHPRPEVRQSGRMAGPLTLLVLHCQPSLPAVVRYGKVVSSPTATMCLPGPPTTSKAAVAGSSRGQPISSATPKSITSVKSPRSAAGAAAASLPRLVGLSTGERKPSRLVRSVTRKQGSEQLPSSSSLLGRNLGPVCRSCRTPRVSPLTGPALAASSDCRGPWSRTHVRVTRPWRSSCDPFAQVTDEHMVAGSVPLSEAG